MKDKIIEYINEKKTDYAIMISGEWGIGKTYFIKNDLKKNFETAGKRMVYVSLIGTSSDEQLERKIFEKINPFYNYEKSDIAREAEYLESLVYEKQSEIKIPENCVLILDDLERINHRYFALVMGYLNTFIEHNNTKCIFACNEEELKNKIKSYKKTKEKYIRYTYPYEPDLKKIIEEKIKEIGGGICDGLIDINEIMYVFKKGKNFNVRTVFYALSTFSKVIQKIEKRGMDFSDRKGEIMQLMLNYICFYSIEYKRGISPEVLNKITVSTYSISGTKNKSVSEIESKEGENNEITLIKEIQERYFKVRSIRFEYFMSIANYMITSDLDVEVLKVDINLVQKNLANNDLKNRDQLISNILRLSNASYVEEIKKLIDYAEKGELNLVSYYKLFDAFLFFKSHNLSGLEDIKRVKEKFERGIKATIKKDRAYIPDLDYQIFRKEEEGTNNKQLNDLRESILKTNKELKDNKNFKEGVEIFDLIAKSKTKELYVLLSNRDKFHLHSESALILLQALKGANADVIDSFTDSLVERYKVYGSDGIVFQTRKYEMEFIRTLCELLDEDPSTNDESEKKMSDIQLVLLKNHLKRIIDEEVKK